MIYEVNTCLLYKWIAYMNFEYEHINNAYFYEIFYKMLRLIVQSIIADKFLCLKSPVHFSDFTISHNINLSLLSWQNHYFLFLYNSNIKDRWKSGEKKGENASTNTSCKSIMRIQMSTKIKSFFKEVNLMHVCISTQYSHTERLNLHILVYHYNSNRQEA